MVEKMLCSPCLSAPKLLGEIRGEVEQHIGQSVGDDDPGDLPGAQDMPLRAAEEELLRTREVAARCPRRFSCRSLTWRAGPLSVGDVSSTRCRWAARFGTCSR